MTAKTSGDYRLPGELDLNLPEGENIGSEPPRYTATEMAKMCEAMLPYWNKIRFIDGRDTPPPSSEFFRLT